MTELKSQVREGMKMAFSPTIVVECGGCNNGKINRGNDKVEHPDCLGSGYRIPKNYGRPVKAKSRRGQPSPWTRKDKKKR